MTQTAHTLVTLLIWELVTPKRKLCCGGGKRVKWSPVSVPSSGGFVPPSSPCSSGKSVSGESHGCCVFPRSPMPTLRVFLLVTQPWRHVSSSLIFFPVAYPILFFFLLCQVQQITLILSVFSLASCDTLSLLPWGGGWSFCAAKSGSFVLCRPQGQTAPDMRD